MLYANDFGKALPYENKDKDIWLAALEDDCSQARAVRLCPLAQEIKPGTRWDAVDMQAARPWPSKVKPNFNYTGSYALNCWLYSDVGADSGPPYFANSNTIRTPAQTPFFMDAIWAVPGVPAGTVPPSIWCAER